MIARMCIRVQCFSFFNFEKLFQRSHSVILLKTVADPELNLGGGLEAWRGEWGGYGRGVPSRCWGFGGLPRENLEKMMQNGAIWNVIKDF